MSAADTTTAMTAEDLAQVAREVRVRRIALASGPYGLVGSMGLGLALEVDESCPTACTDGKTLTVGPAFWRGLTRPHHGSRQTCVSTKTGPVSGTPSTKSTSCT